MKGLLFWPGPCGNLRGAFGGMTLGSFGSCGSCVQDASWGGIASAWIHVSREKGRELREPRQSSRGLDLWLEGARSMSKAESECSTGPRQLAQQL